MVTHGRARMESPQDARDAGEAGEAAAAALIADVLGDDLIFQHTPGEPPQGIDLAYLSDGELHVGEVKAVIGDWHQPSTSLTVDGRQMDSAWVSDRLERVDLHATGEQVGDGDGQVRTDLFQVDFRGDTIARYEMSQEGMRTEAAPQEVWALSHVLDAHEAIHAADEVPHAESEAPEVDSDDSESEGGLAG